MVLQSRGLKLGRLGLYNLWQPMTSQLKTLAEEELSRLQQKNNSLILNLDLNKGLENCDHKVKYEKQRGLLYRTTNRIVGLLEANLGTQWWIENFSGVRPDFMKGPLLTSFNWRLLLIQSFCLEYISVLFGRKTQTCSKLQFWPKSYE